MLEPAGAGIGNSEGGIRIPNSDPRIPNPTGRPIRVLHVVEATIAGAEKRGGGRAINGEVEDGPTVGARTKGYCYTDWPGKGDTTAGHTAIAEEIGVARWHAERSRAATRADTTGTDLARGLRGTNNG